MSIRTFIAAGGVALGFAAVPTSVLSAQVTQDSAARAAEVRADSAFIRQAIEGNLLEVQVGRLADRKAASQSVKEFARRMVTDHTVMQKQWSDLASRYGMSFKPTLQEIIPEEARELDRLSGAEFDRAYMTSMIQNHQRDAQTFRAQSQSADAPEVRQLAANGLTTIQQHLTLAAQIGREVGVPTDIATLPPDTQVTPTNPPAAPPPAAPPTAEPGRRTEAEREEDRARNVRRDRDYIQNVLAAHYMEVRLGELAQERARNPAVKRFADQMVTLFTTFQNQWTGMAARNGSPVKAGMGRLHREKVIRLERASRAEFDRVYMTTVIQHHEALLPYYKKEGRQAHSGPVRNLVERQLPSLQQSYAEAKRVGRRVGVEDTERRKDVSGR